MRCERPILFSGPMVRAILDGTKTQTRRLVKPRGGWTIDERDDGTLWPMDPTWSSGDAHDPWWPCPFGEPGDRLWVRETHAVLCRLADPVCPCEAPPPAPGANHCVEYRADTEAARPGGWDAAPDDAEAAKWKPSIHMPRWASRITLEVTGVRVERLQDITEKDAREEGVAPAPFCKAGRATGLEHVEAFEDLWDTINGKRATWASNPWVWVVGFRRVT